MTSTSNNAHLSRYIVGFVLSLVLTGTAYVVTVRHALDMKMTIAIVLLLAMMQATAQLVFFLHLGQEPRPRWKLAVFCFMLLVLAILVIGSLWIMQNLDYNMTNPSDIVHDEGYQ